MAEHWWRTVPIDRDFKQGYVDGFDEKPRQLFSLSYIAGYREGTVLRAFYRGELVHAEKDPVAEERRELASEGRPS